MTSTHSTHARPGAYPARRWEEPAVRPGCRGSVCRPSARARGAVWRRRRPPCTVSSAAAGTTGSGWSVRRRPPRLSAASPTMRRASTLAAITKNIKSNRDEIAQQHDIVIIIVLGVFLNVVGEKALNLFGSSTFVVYDWSTSTPLLAINVKVW